MVPHAGKVNYDRAMKKDAPAADAKVPAAASAAKEGASGRLSSVTSALLVMKAFSAEEAEIGISSLAKRLKLAKSTVHRLAVTLAAEGFLEQNADNGRYRLGLSLFTLGALARRRMDVSNVSRPLLGVLRDKYQDRQRGRFLILVAQHTEQRPRDVGHVHAPARQRAQRE